MSKRRGRTAAHNSVSRSSAARSDSAPLANFFAQEPYVVGGNVTLNEDAVRHLKVLRLGSGARLSLRDGEGHVATGALVKLSKSYAVVEVETAGEVPRGPEIHLMAPIADRERMLWLAEKAAEMQVRSWRPVMWRRSKSVSPRGEGSTFQGKVRLRMISALLQCGGAWLPEMFPEANIERAVAAAAGGTKLLLDPDGVPILSAEIKEPVSIALGPEGGFEDTERERFVQGGFTPVTLGGSLLRVETAGTAGMAIVKAALNQKI